MLFSIISCTFLIVYKLFNLLPFPQSGEDSLLGRGRNGPTRWRDHDISPSDQIISDLLRGLSSSSYCRVTSPPAFVLLCASLYCLVSFQYRLRTEVLPYFLLLITLITLILIT